MDLKELIRERNESGLEFEAIHDLDFYDGSLTGICNIKNSKIAIAFKICYYDVNRREKLFLLTQPQPEVLAEMKKVIDGSPSYDLESIGMADRLFKELFQQSDQYYITQSGFFGKGISRITEFPKSEMIIFTTVEEVIEYSFEKDNVYLKYLKLN